MKINNKTELLEFLRRESLRILNEDNQALSSLHDKVNDVDDYFISTDEKKLERLNSEEEKAVDKEDYADLQRIKEEKKNVLGKLIVSYRKKIELYEELRGAISQELENMGVKGSSVFKNKEINEFSNETTEKGTTLKISSLVNSITIQKVNENNQYKVIDSTAPYIQAGDIVAIPNVKIGGSLKIKVYRQIGDRYNEVGETTIQNVRQIIKNPEA